VPRPRSLLCVHAHPDDEALFTAGVMARYAAEGVRSTLVTCTDGSLGFAPDGTGPTDPNHDRDIVTKARIVELGASCDLLGVDRLELLGYHDSGMTGWPQNEEAGAFINQDLDEVAARIAGVIAEERPQVIVTYDANGFYGHPDHIQANRITVAALAASGLTATLLYTAIPKSAFKRFRAVMQEAGIEGPGSDGEDPPFGTPDEEIGIIVDIEAVADVKFDALSAHSSQTDDSFFLKMGRERFKELFRNEYFVRAQDPFGRTGVDHDLFVGWR
jgi:LmbE family N-acetylglucosaminyl deacetylase